jgi:hypothetical protein
MFCNLVQLDSGRWGCPACDPRGERTLPTSARRHCGAPSEQPAPPPLLAARMLQAELQQAVANGDLGLPLDEVEARLAVCRGCGQFLGMGCRVFSARHAPCRAWFWALVASRVRNIESCPQWPDT